MIFSGAVNYRDPGFLAINATNPIAVAHYYQTHPIPREHNPAIIVASIVVSALGAETTLLLLSRRTATAGMRNWVLLLLAASTMSSVGIWGMHFIGMNMTLQPTPDINWYIQFDPGFTVLSLFVPMLALVFAFVFVGTGPESLPIDEKDELLGVIKGNKDEKPSKSAPKSIQSFFYSIWKGNSAGFVNLRIVIGGLIVGGTVALMHYSAGFGSSFRCEYHYVHLVFSIVLACVASTISLLVFFRFQAQWQGNWWKKLICALGLAVGVCGMHYLGLSGTDWFVPRERTDSFYLGQSTSNVLTISIAVMCFAVCIISLIIVISDFLVTQESRRKARRVVIVSATFDKGGRVLVNLDGMLPMCEVQTEFPIKNIMEELNYRQPTFQWLYTLSWDWSILDPFISGIVAGSLGLVASPPSTPHFGGQPRIFKGLKEPGSSYTASKSDSQITSFKDKCIETTQTLATQIGVHLDQMGVFFDNILLTGTRFPANPKASNKTMNMKNDEESSTFNFPTQKDSQKQGVMLFLVRELSGENQDTIDGYVKRGYRFADIRWFAPVFADRAGVEKSEVDGLLEQLKLYAKRGTKPCVRSNGVYVGFFAVRPSISRQGGIDTLVYQFARHQIPAYRLPDVEKITDEMRDWVRTMSGRKMKELGEHCLQEVDNSSTLPSGKAAEEMWIFKSSLVLAMDAMKSSLKMFPDLPNRSLLSAEIVEIPSSSDDSTETASMIVFQATVPGPKRYGEELPGLAIQHEPFGSYKKKTPAPNFVFVPYTLFSKCQMMMLRASGSKKFARQIRAELAQRYPPAAKSISTRIGTPTDHPSNLHLSQKLSGRDPDLDTPTLPFSMDVHDEDVYTNMDYKYGGTAGTPAQIEARNAIRRQSQISTLSNILQPISGTENISRVKRNSDRYFLEQTSSPSTANQSHFRYSDYEGIPAPEYSDYIPVSSKNTPRPVRKVSEVKNGFTEKDGHVQFDIREEQPRLRTKSTEVTEANRYQLNRDNSSISSPNDKLDVSNLGVSRASGNASSSKSGAQLLAVEARLRSDDWPARCLDALEQSEAGEELLGVQW